MDSDWREVNRLLLPPPAGTNIPTPITTFAFDTHQELLWAGNDYGRVTSFIGTEMQRYTSFRAHPPTDGAVRQLLFNDKGLIVLGPRNVHMSIRGGPAVWNATHPEMQDLNCMSFTSRGTSEVLVAGNQAVMFVIDVNKGEITKQLPTDRNYTIMKRSHHICAATRIGTVDILDAVTFNVLKTWTAHSGIINDMDVQTDFIVTCGASLKQQGPSAAYMLDAYVNVFDLKKMASLPPIAFPSLAAFVRMHPRMVTTAIVVSQQGQIHIIDLMNPNTSNVKQANIMHVLTKLEISPTGEALALADSECYMHLWGSGSKTQFTELPTPIELPPDEQPAPRMDWTDTPLNTVGMPYYREALLSAWPNLISDAGAPPVRFEKSYLDSMQKWDHGLFGPHNRAMLRNQVEDTRASEKSYNSIQAPKFLSDKSRESANASSNLMALIDTPRDTLGLRLEAEIASLKAEAPNMYRAVEIKFSKFGVDDFDFGYYNRTHYAGLENHITNSYANSLLQVLHFTPQIRNLALRHAASSCLDAYCLLCELGFVCDMLQKAEGSTCQATNMLKMLSSHQPAHSLRLIEEENQAMPVSDMIQALTRFLLGQAAKDFQRISPQLSDFEEILATSGVTLMRCMQCATETTRPTSTYVNDLKYPVIRHPPRGGRAPKVTFSQVLKSSIEQDDTNKGWCNRCQRYQTLSNRKTISKIPAVLTLNANGQNAGTSEFRRLWATPGWLPEDIGIIVDQAGQFFCYEGDDLRYHLQRGIHKIMVYSLIGMAVNVDGGPPQKPHLVAMVNVGHAEPTAAQESQWHLFNDFLVQPVSTREALSFNTAWKTPSVVVFQLKSDNNKVDTEWKNYLDTSVLYLDQKPDFEGKTYRSLNPDLERSGPETIVAIDAEFVALKQPEIEMNAEGEGKTIRPMIHALARVSVVRGQGEDEGLAFIDDYVTINEQIVDYLTTFSGITKDDLDPRVSQHSLVPLKTAYKKLWTLLNLGCKFLGHGLRQDFRVINIHIPKSQIIDTIDLLFLKSWRRKLSLAFLASNLLGEDIQLGTHDSIEDARTALKLYRKYQEFDDAGILEPMLQQIYHAGRETNFKPPRRGDQAITRTDTPNIASEGIARPSTPSRPGGGAVQAPGSAFSASKSNWTPGKPPLPK